MEIMNIIGLGGVVVVCAAITFCLWVIVSLVTAVKGAVQAMQDKADAYMVKAKAYDNYVKLMQEKYYDGRDENGYYGGYECD